MTPGEAGRVLHAATALDARMKPADEETARARAVLWAQTLDADIPFEWACMTVVAHYADHTTVVMPAHLNTTWRRQRAIETERERASRFHAEAEQRRLDAVPMPAHLREQMRQIGAGSGQGD